MLRCVIQHVNLCQVLSTALLTACQVQQPITCKVVSYLPISTGFYLDFTKIVPYNSVVSVCDGVAVVKGLVEIKKMAK